MSKQTVHYSDPSDSAVAAFLLDNDSEELTDALVAALEEAFRTLAESAYPEKNH